jgi:FAD-dependent oxidoreductase domain-containing protein 1
MPQEPKTAYDVVIVGGGVIGSAIAYFLSSDRGFQGRVAVVERDPLYTIASSSLSTSGIRQQFGTRPNVAMSAYGIEFLRELNQHLSVEGHEADIVLREQGYLILGAKNRVTEFEARNRLQRSWGVPAELLYPAELALRFPWLNTDDLGVGSYGTEKEGWFDGPGLLQAFKRKARSQGVQYIPATVVGLEMDSPSKVAAVLLDTGDRLAAGTVVNAAGAWSGQIARMAGADLPIVPRKRCVFVLDSPEKIPDAPFIFDPGGCFLRPEGQRYICGVTPVQENAPDDFGLEVDYGLFEDIIWPALAHRIPGFERLKMLGAWAGLYEYNTFDQSSIIGRHPEIANFVIASGFSGHGMMHSPAAGAGVSELIAYGRYRSIDLSPFGLERIEANNPIQEHVY